MDKRYTGRQVLAIMRETFPNSEADFQPEFLDHFEHAVFSQDELEQLLETFPKTEFNFAKRIPITACSGKRGWQLGETMENV